jgi:hypothetical protein
MLDEMGKHLITRDEHHRIASRISFQMLFAVSDTSPNCSFV